MYHIEKERIKDLFEQSPFTIDSLKNLENYSTRLLAKFRHIENVANLMESAATVAGFSEKEKLLAFTAGQFHDIACINDIALTGKEYGPKHGARGAIITIGLLTQSYNGFSKEEIDIIATAITNHDGATTENLIGFTKSLTTLLRDCDKIDCYRRQAEEPLENFLQRPLQPNSPIRTSFAERSLAGLPLKYAEMKNSNEEIILYAGWLFQLENASCKKMALPYFEAFIKRMLGVTTDDQTILYLKEAFNQAIRESSH